MTAVVPLAAVLGAADGGRVAVPKLRDGADWEPLLAVAGPTGLMPALWSASQRLGLLDPVPSELVDVLGKWLGQRNHVAAVLQFSYLENARRNADLVRQLDEVATLLAGDGIPVVALKGIGHVVRGVWPDPADRMMNDLDLLVPAHAAVDAQARLRTVGYELAPGRARAADQHHLETLRREQRFGAIEVHRQPLARGWTEALPAVDVINAARPVPGHPSVLVPSPTHAAVIALVHAYLADAAWHDRVIPLRNVHELWRFAAHEAIDWAEVRSRLRRVGRSSLVDEHLVSAWSLLGAPRPPATLSVQRARVRLALATGSTRRFSFSGESTRRLLVPLDAFSRALDAGRLRRHYGTGIGGPWRLRAHHLRRALWRRS